MVLYIGTFLWYLNRLPWIFQSIVKLWNHLASIKLTKLLFRQVTPAGKHPNASQIFPFHLPLTLSWKPPALNPVLTSLHFSAAAHTFLTSPSPFGMHACLILVLREQVP